jgi:hypothetical protein
VATEQEDESEDTRRKPPPADPPAASDENPLELLKKRVRLSLQLDVTTAVP